VQKSKKSGLPEQFRMKHEGHYVDLISARTAAPRIRMISVDRIDPNPHQARSELGNIQELMESIKAKGVLEPILVRPKGDRFDIIAGERRYVASKNAGLSEVPCIEMNVDENEAVEIALIENLQRKDLNIFEEADGLNTLATLYSYNHQQISEKIGKARSSITEILSISRIPKHLREKISGSKFMSRSTVIEIAKQKTEADMEALVDEIIKRRLTREDTRDLSKMIKGKKSKKLKYYVYNYIPEDSDKYKLRIEFKQQTVTRTEIIRILENILNKLRSRA
jgi:ParB family transcriptional regulator, chromosome partitioning protein